MMAAIRAGDYARAYDALRFTSKGATPTGASIGAFLLALLERFDEADALAQRASVDGIARIVRGERERTLRARDPMASRGLRTVGDAPVVALYAAMAQAFALGDEGLADRTRAQLAEQARPIAGTITFANGQAREFRDIADADDAIGQMLEAYDDQGLLYLPFETLRRIATSPRKHFIDDLMPEVEVIGAQGAMRVHVPLLYACSATASIDHLRNGRATTFEYLGTARRGRGQRDFRVDGAMVGFQSIASIDFA